MKAGQMATKCRFIEVKKKSIEFHCAITSVRGKLKAEDNFEAQKDERKNAGFLFVYHSMIAVDCTW